MRKTPIVYRLTFDQIKQNVGFRVEPGGEPPGTPTDPYVRISRIRFLWIIVSLRRLSVPPLVEAEDSTGATY